MVLRRVCEWQAFRPPVDGGGNNDSGDKGGAKAVSGGIILGVAVLSR